MKKLIPIIIFCLFTLQCEQGWIKDILSPKEDGTFPVASILSPASGATVSEITTIEVYATDNVGIWKIDFYIADVLVNTDFESPYEYEWNTSSYSDGVDYTIVAKAFDTSENMTVVAPMLLTVDNTDKYPTSSTFYGRYEDRKFLLSWTQNSDSDFASYVLYEDETYIYTTDSNIDTSYVITGIGENTRREYRLIISDTIGLQTADTMRCSSYQKIAFPSENDINIIDIDGDSQSRKNITSEFDRIAMFPQFTPDGKKIIYSNIEFIGVNGDYYIMNIDGTEKTNITNGSVSNDIDMSGYKISSDGTKILFYGGGDCYDIWIINIDGTELTNLTNTPTTCERYPDFSGDGQKIVFTVDGDVYTMDSDGTNRTRLLNFYQNDAEYPIYSPDGVTIAFLDNSNLWIMLSNGTSRVQLTTSVTVTSNQIEETTFTPNSHSLVFRTGTSPYGIGFVNIDGTGETNLTPNSQCHEPSLSSDGSKIVFIEQGINRSYLKLMDIDGSNVETLYEGSIPRPRIQPTP